MSGLGHSCVATVQTTRYIRDGLSCCHHHENHHYKSTACSLTRCVMSRTRAPRPSRAAPAGHLKGASRVAAECSTAHHADFLKTFHRQAAQKRAQRKKTHPLTAEEHAALRKQIGRVHFITPRLRRLHQGQHLRHPGQVAALLLLQRRPIHRLQARRLESLSDQCRLAGPDGDVRLAISIEDVRPRGFHGFLYWICDNYRIKSWGTSWEYFRQFKQLFAAVRGQYMDRNDSKEVPEVCISSSAPPTLSVACRHIWLTSLTKVPRLVPGQQIQPPAAQYGRETSGRFWGLARPADLQHWL